MFVYIDNEYKCHVAPGEGLREFEVPEFDDKCPEYIEGYRYIPFGETWVREDGEQCSGMSPWKDYDELEKAQLKYENAQYEAALIEKQDMQNALELLGVNPNG